ncbi:MAG TPA: hypothetical protein VN540_03410 [Clostridia bacterium]|nr:hypothetical protein [Clostridia bacterium]
MNGGVPAALAYFLVPLALTVLIEGLVGAAFRMKKEEQRALFLVNLVTNPSVCLLLYFYRLLVPWGDAFAIALLECAVVLVEWRLLKALCGGGRRWLAVSLACNAASFGAGALISLILS